MKIGIFGGTFNPIHNGHIALAKAFLDQSGLDQVWFLVSPQNPFKRNITLLEDKARLEMVRKALHNEGNIIASDYEFHLSRPSYTWNTLQHLAKDHPQDSFTLLIGGDNWLAFDKWYHAEEILHSYKIMVYPRKGSEISEEELPHNVTLLKTPLLEISSTQIRKRVANKEDISALVPHEIIEDITRYYTTK